MLALNASLTYQGVPFRQCPIDGDREGLAHQTVRYPHIHTLELITEPEETRTKTNDRECLSNRHLHGQGRQSVAEDQRDKRNGETQLSIASSLKRLDSTFFAQPPPLVCSRRVTISV